MYKRQIYTFADFLAARVLLAPECAPLLPALALSIPFCAIHACCCGYYYGLKKTAVPAFSQVVEQCIRIFSVLLIVHVCHTNRIPITVLLAVWGLLIGEAASAVFCLLVYGCSKSVAILPNANTPITPLLLPLLTMALPLMANRLTLSFPVSYTHLYYDYSQIGHFWMKGYEYLRQLEYRIAILRDKLDYLGEESCSTEERELAALTEFPPLNVCCYPAVPEKYRVDVYKRQILTSP